MRTANDDDLIARLRRAADGQLVSATLAATLRWAADALEAQRDELAAAWAQESRMHHDRDAARAVIAETLAIHALHNDLSTQGEGPHCEHDGQSWPCETVAILSRVPQGAASVWSGHRGFAADEVLQGAAEPSAVERLLDLHGVKAPNFLAAIADRRVAPDRETRANIEQIIHMMTEAEWGTYWINTMRGLLEPLAGDDMVTGRDHLLDDAEGPRQDTEPSEPWQDPEPWVSPDGKRWHRQAMSDEKHKPRSRAVYDAETKGPKQ